MCFLGITGCVLPEQSAKQLNCPKPTQNCQPGSWRPTETELAVDTSATYIKYAETYYRFFRVKNINTPVNEWGVGFLGNNLAALTFDDGNQQRAMIIKFTNEDRAIFQSGMGIPIDGSVGSISAVGNNVAFSAKESEFSIMNPDKANISADKEGKLAFHDAIYPSSDIYTGKLKNNLIYDVKNISKSKKFDIFNWESQPAFSPDGNVLIFSSDKPYENMGIELWFMVKDNNGNWSEPINCGNYVNSSCDELTPFISNDGSKLLFASTGHSTVGGYDIFESKISSQFWEDAKSGDLEKLKKGIYFSSPKNLKTPLNTVADELYPSSPGNPDDLLYYSSNQSDDAESIILRKGGFDIYVRKKFTKEKSLAEGNKRTDKLEDLGISEVKQEQNETMPDVKFDTPQEYTMKGTVFNKKTRIPVPEAELVVKDINEQDEYKIDTLYTRADKLGNYKVKLKKSKEYEITAQAPELFFETQKMNVESKNPIIDTLVNFNIPDELTLRINFPYDVYSTPYKYVLDSNGIETNSKWNDEIELLIKNIKASEGKIKKLILIGHTDDVGSEDYNRTLGLNRVKFVVNQLVSRGIPKDLLEYSSKGKLEPLFRKTDEDINTYRKRLRRVELQKVLF